MTTPTQFQKVRQYLHGLMDLASAEQMRRLADLRVTDPDVSVAVARLLACIAPEDLPPPQIPVGPEAVRHSDPSTDTEQRAGGHMEPG